MKIMLLAILLSDFTLAKAQLLTIKDAVDQAIQNSNTHNIINARSKDEEVIIFVNREKRLIVDICINMD